MRLKRGVERASCDFCHRRKIKCDRLPRARQGHASCSHCSLRLLECRLDDSDDIRIRRRRQTNLQSDLVGAMVQEQRDVVIDRPPVNHNNIETTTHSPLSGHLTEPSPQQSSLLFPESEFTVLSSSQVIDADTPLPGHNLDVLSLDPPFELSSDSLLFLDQIFTAEDQHGALSTMLRETPDQFDAPIAVEEHSSDTTPAQLVGDSNIDNAGHQQPWMACNLDQNTFITALQAYFNFAALCLPVIYEDAFWQDYHAGRCSLSLVYAIACCGMPFTTVMDKWDIQQRLALRFRTAFFQARHEMDSQQHIRLDDLEALALMVDFEYENFQGSSFHSHLETLFLKHDSLVLLTLQSRIRDGNSTDSDSSTTLTRASERRSLLFWHVYGLDAFYSLDKMSISRIQDHDIDFNKNLTNHKAGSYLDTILALAYIARRIVQALCSATVRRRGIEPTDLLSLFAQLDHWRNNLCPLYLQRQRVKAAQATFEEVDNSAGSTPASNQSQLHRAAVWLLEINCYMQIENYVTEYGIQDGTSLEAEMVTLRVEHEALRAVHDAVEVAHWNERLRIKGQGEHNHYLADINPNILRNLFAGTCYWICHRGVELLNRNVSATMPLGPVPGRKAGQDEQDLKRQRIFDYIKVADTLRDAVASAVSHKDTKQVLERVDKQRAVFKERATNI